MTRMRQSAIVGVLPLLAVLLLLASEAAGQSVLFTTNVGDYSISVQPDGLSITQTAGGRTFLRRGRFLADVVAFDQSAGTLTLILANRDVVKISALNESQFLEFRWTLRAPDHHARTLNNLPLLSFSPVTDGEDPVMLGTGGPDNGNSYMFLVNADKKTRRGVVTAWLTSERGSGVMLTGDDGRVTTRMDYGVFDVAAGETEVTDSLLLGWFGDALAGLEAYGDAIAKHYQIHLPPQKCVYCTWYHSGASNEKQLAQTTDFVAAQLKEYGLDVLQIDDGWQSGIKTNGPKRDFTKCNPKGPYPSGMKATEDRVLAAGLIPGIWWMPFAGTAEDPHYADKQDFFVKEADGRPREVRWGGWCLDMTNPKALAYVRENARRIARDWHYKYFKLDGLWTGFAAKLLYVNEGFREDDYGQQRRFDSSIPPVQAYRIGMQTVRKGAGDDVFILGCNLAQNMRTMGASYGLFDAMRVGPDNNARNWPSLVRGVFNSANRYFLNGRVWYNDPDPHYVRPIVPLAQAQTLSSWVGLSGFLNTTSEQYRDLPPERLDLLRRTLPAHGMKVTPVDFLEQRVARVWNVTDTRVTPARHAIGMFNWEVEDQKSVSIDRSLAQCNLDNAKTYVGFDFWRNQFLPEVRSRIQVALPYNECRIWSLRERTDHPMVVSTSRHVTQGIVDIIREQWDPGTRTLNGASRIVAGDRYELRVWTPNGARPKSVALEGDSNGATIQLVKSADKDGFRVTIESPQTTVVAWRLVF